MPRGGRFHGNRTKLQQLTGASMQSEQNAPAARLLLHRFAASMREREYGRMGRGVGGVGEACIRHIGSLSKRSALFDKCVPMPVCLSVKRQQCQALSAQYRDAVLVMHSDWFRLLQSGQNTPIVVNVRRPIIIIARRRRSTEHESLSISITEQWIYSIAIELKVTPTSTYCLSIYLYNLFIHLIINL